MIRMAEKMKQARFDLHPCLLEIEGGDADAVAAVEGDNTGSPGCRAILECHRWSGDCIFPRRAGLSEIDVYIPNVLGGARSNTAFNCQHHGRRLQFREALRSHERRSTHRTIPTRVGKTYRATAAQRSEADHRQAHEHAQHAKRKLRGAFNQIIFILHHSSFFLSP